MRYVRASFTYIADDDIFFPPNPVNTFRGALGYRLKSISCIQRNRHNGSCSSCLIAKNCAYALCYETSQNNLKCKVNSNSKDVPHLMILDDAIPPSRIVKKGERFTFYVQLFSHATTIFPHIILASSDIGKIGLTNKRTKCNLVSVMDENTNTEIWNNTSSSITIPQTANLILNEPTSELDEKSKIQLEFVTPIAFKDRNTGKVTTKPEFQRIIGSLMRRYSTFEASENNHIRWNFSRLANLARQVELVSDNLQPVRWKRFSSRQKQYIPISGVIGRATYEGPIKPFIQLLTAAKIIRAGRSTTFGQGKIFINSFE